MKPPPQPSTGSAGGTLAAPPALRATPPPESEPPPPQHSTGDAGGTLAAPPTSMMALVARAASDPAVDVAKMQALLDMQERVEARQAVAEFNSALGRVSAAIPRIKKNGRVDLGTGKGGYAFATWEDMDTALRPLMQAEGFTLSFDMTTKEGGGAVVSGTALHAGGHSKTVSVPLALDSGAGRNNLQAMGSTLSYGKRYCAEMLFNIVRENADDDGRAGGTVYILQEVADQISETLTRKRIPESMFLDLMAVRSVTEIELKDLPKARNAIKSWKADAPSSTAGAAP